MPTPPPSDEAQQLIRANAARVTVASASFVESDFARLREASVAAAPLPAAPDAVPAVDVGELRPGDVHDPQAAILGAARCLRAAGARPAAAFCYNCSAAYVDAVERYAGRIRRSERAFRQYDARPLVVRTPVGYRRRAPASKQGQVGSHRGLSRRLCLHTAAPGLSPASTL
jgi:hypothetical protein